MVHKNENLGHRTHCNVMTFGKDKTCVQLRGMKRSEIEEKESEKQLFGLSEKNIKYLNE